MIECKEAVTEDEKLAAYSLRYQVYLDVGHIKPNESKLLFDDLEDCSTTFIAIDTSSGKVVGTLRITPGKGGKFESLDHINPFLTKNMTNCAELSKMAIDNEYQKGFKKNSVYLKLIQTMYKYCLKNEIEDLFVITIDRNAKIYEKSGFKRVSEPFFYEKYFREHWVLKLEIHEAEKYVKGLFKKLMLLDKNTESDA